MAIVFDEITGSVEPNGQREAGDQEPAAAPPAPDLKPTAMKRAIKQMRQRESRLRAS
jgi:hypothetical protein